MRVCNRLFVTTSVATDAIANVRVGRDAAWQREGFAFLNGTVTLKRKVIFARNLAEMFIIMFSMLWHFDFSTEFYLLYNSWDLLTVKWFNWLQMAGRLRAVGKGYHEKHVEEEGISYFSGAFKSLLFI